MIFTASQKRQAIEREIGFRKRVYPRQVAEKKMTQSAMDEQIALMEAIADDYRRAEQRERLL